MKLPAGYVAGEGVRKATAYGGFGEKMLQKMGWEKGLGLGKNKDGIASAIEVKKKEDNSGVGQQGGWNWDLKYWESAYESGIQQINHDSDSSSDSSDSSDDEEPALGGMTVNRDGTIASASREELKLAKMLAKDSRGRAGRFGGRDGKMARIRAMEEEQAAAARAKLGVELPKSGGKSEKKGKKGEKSEKRKRQEEGGSKKRSRKDSSSSSGSEDESDSSDTNMSQEQQQEQQQASKPKPPVYIVRLPDDGKPVTPFKPTPGEGWWGAKLFASAGCLGGLDEAAEHVSRERKTFNEDDQTALYMSAHDKQRQGRRGLGKSTTLKIAGGKWEGTKVTFDEQGQQQEGAAGSSGEAAAEAAGDSAAGSSKKSKRKSEKKDTAGKKKGEKKSEKKGSKSSKGSSKEEAAAAAAATAAAGSSSGGKVKWAKLAQKVLKKQPEQQMRFKHLWRALLDLGHHDGDADMETLQALCLKKLCKCEAVKVEGKVVQLLA